MGDHAPNPSPLVTVTDCQDPDTHSITILNYYFHYFIHCNHNQVFTITCTMLRYCQTIFSSLIYYLPSYNMYCLLTLCSCLLIYRWQSLDGSVCNIRRSIMRTSHLVVVIVHILTIFSAENWSLSASHLAITNNTRAEWRLEPNMSC